MSAEGTGKWRVSACPFNVNVFQDFLTGGYVGWMPGECQNQQVQAAVYKWTEEASKQSWSDSPLPKREEFVVEHPNKNQG